MKRSWLSALVMVAMLSAWHAHAESINELSHAALQGDYEAQRNLAYLFSHGGEGTSKDIGQACLWREVIMQSGYASVHTGDVVDRDADCRGFAEKDRAAIRAKAMTLSQGIYSKLPAKTPGFGESVWDDDFFEDDEKVAKHLVALERKAFSKDANAQRELATTLSSQAAADAFWHNREEEACVWWRVVANGINGQPIKTDSGMAENICNGLGPESFEVANARFARISGELKRTN